MSEAKDHLSARERTFVNEYLVDREGKAAAIRAGYSKKSAKVIACELLRKPRIKAAVDAALEAQEKRTLVTADYVISNLKEVVERCLQRAPVMVREGHRLVQKTDEQDRAVWEFDSQGANKALELLGKHLKLFTDKVDLTSNGNTIKALLLEE